MVAEPLQSVFEAEYESALTVRNHGGCHYIVVTQEHRAAMFSHISCVLITGVQHDLCF
jgi:hypothetical protein